MKKYIKIGLSLATAISLNANEIQVNGGWSLLGAIGSVQPSQIPCAKTVWSYDNGTSSWMLYTRQNAGDGLDTPANYGYTSISSIQAGEGFWVNADSTGCSFSYGDIVNVPVTTFNMFGYVWTDVKIDDRYTRSGNSVVADSTNGIISLTSTRVDDLHSRTEAVITLSEPTDIVKAQVNVVNTSTGYNTFELRGHANVVVGGINYRAYNVIGLSKKSIFAYMILKDQSGNKTKVFDTLDTNGNSTMFYDGTTSLVGKNIELKIGKNDDNSITFSAIDMSPTPITIVSKTFIPDSNDTLNDFDTVKLRTKIADDNANTDGNTAGETIVVNIADVSTDDIVTSTAATLSWNNFSTGLNTGDDDNWYGNFTKNDSNKTITIADNDYYDGQWNTHDSKEIGYTINSDTNLSVVGSDGFEGDIIIKGTQKVDAINGTLYNDLYVTDMEFHVTASGSEWTDIWDWAPTYRDGSSEHNVTTTEELKNMYLTNDNWLGDGGNYYMLSGSTSDTSGEIVRGEQDGYWDNCTEGDCKKIIRTPDVINDASWSFDSSGLHIVLPTESQTLTMVADSTSPTGYYVQSVGKDKVGAVWHEKLYTGSDATDTNIQNILSY